MHTAFVIAAGVALLIACNALGYAFGHGIAGVVTDIQLFIPVWFFLSLLNLYFGVSKEGYSLAEELPMSMLVFGQLTVIAGGLAWRFSRAGKRSIATD